MVSVEEFNNALDSMIFSASGWRGIFAASGGEESASEQITPATRIICAAAAFVFAEYLGKDSRVLVGCDTRPTGKTAAPAIISVLLSCGCDVRFSDFTAAPEIMAWARSASDGEKTGFIYISASHNPIGHNGLKFGLNDGGVLAAEESAKLIADFRGFVKRDDCIEKIESLIAAGSNRLESVYAGIAAAKAEAVKAYFDFCGDVAWGKNAAIAAAVRDGLEKRPLGLVCDFNGSARTVSVDRGFFSSLGLKFECINDEPGQIAHRIVPEGESLEPCRELLEKAHARDASFALGYVPDCDGDRGNLVVWDEVLKKACALEACAPKAYALEAQEVFALACVAEFSHLVWTGELSFGADGKPLSKAAVAANDPTSMRIDRIAESFGVDVFRAEVGEANVVKLARNLRERGYIVRILGEGSAGGNITFPSAVRDPVSTVIAIVKLLSVYSRDGKPGLFEIWCKFSNQTEKYRENFTLADIIASLPKFSTTPAYSEKAVLRINTQDHGLLKDRYQKIFMREWEERKDELKARFGLYKWEAIAYNGTEEKRGLSRFGDAGRGGLKILFTDGEGKNLAYIWMRGSATEPVFRIMADSEGSDSRFEGYLLEWQYCMIIEADKE